MAEKTCQGCREPIKSGRYCDTCEKVPVFRGYARAELCDAFDRVKHPDNWKMPIDCVLPGMLSRRDRDVIEAAVIFFAGCEPGFSRWGRDTRVEAVGYYAAVGA